MSSYDRDDFGCGIAIWILVIFVACVLIYGLITGQ